MDVRGLPKRMQAGNWAARPQLGGICQTIMVQCSKSCCVRRAHLVDAQDGGRALVAACRAVVQH